MSKNLVNKAVERYMAGDRKALKAVLNAAGDMQAGVAASVMKQVAAVAHCVRHGVEMVKDLQNAGAPAPTKAETVVDYKYAPLVLKGQKALARSRAA